MILPSDFCAMGSVILGRRVDDFVIGPSGLDLWEVGSCSILVIVKYKA